MSGAQHTPGPWVFSFESVDPEWAVVTTSGGSVLANVNSRNDRDANARLIAAAPDLLAALIRFRAKVYNAAIANGMDDEWATEACSAADAAIAKATGAKP